MSDIDLDKLEKYIRQAAKGGLLIDALYVTALEAHRSRK